MGLYLPNGYLNIADIDDRGQPFNILVGGRGIGKTYGLLRHYIDKGSRIIYMRRTAEQAKITGKAEFSPYKTVCGDMGMAFTTSKTNPRFVSMGTEAELEDGGGERIAYVMALSTFSNIRGIDGSDCEAIVYDEFIPEKRERPLVEEGEALFNAYETINRNRELQGQPPVKLWLVSNANRLDSPIFAALGIMNIMLQMRKKKQERLVIPERGLQILQWDHSPISQAKAKTALYKLVDTTYKDMALSNEYRFDDAHIVQRNLQEYRPVCAIGEVYIYKHKSEPRYYLTTHSSGTVKKYGTGESEVRRFIKTYGALLDYYLLGFAEAESVEVDYIFRTLLDL